MDSLDFDFDSDYIVDVYNDGENAALGTQLLEVFAVKLSRNCEVYGSFYVKDGERTLCYYNRQPEDCEPINEDRDWSLSLSGPHRPVSATSHIEFLLDLMDKNGDEFIKKSLSLYLMNNEGNVDELLIDNVFETYRFVEVKGGLASATIYYTLSRVAAQAKIEFELVDESGENGHIDVYGTIVARYGNNYDTSVTDNVVRQHYTFLLFQKELQEKVQVMYGESIPLLRSRVAVPRCTSIAIELNLEFIHSNGFKEQIKNYRVQFQASEQFGNSQTFNLNHGSMVLYVDWWDAFGSSGMLGPAID